MTEPKHLKGSASLCLSYLGNETRFTNGVYLHIFPNCCLAVNVLFVASRVQQLLTKIRTRKWKNPGLNMSTAMLHHTRPRNQKHMTQSGIPWHFFIAIALLQANPI